MHFFAVDHCGRRTLNSYFDSRAHVWRRCTELAGLVGNATSGLVLGESFTAELHDDDADLLVSAATTELIELWQEGFDETRADLFVALEALSSHLANLLRGAWFNIKSNGPQRSRALRTARRGDGLDTACARRRVFAAGMVVRPRVSVEYVDEKSGRPTRCARLAYALQTRSKRDASSSALGDRLGCFAQPLHSQLESGKHGRVDIGVQAVRCYAVALESFLISLLLGG